VFHGCTSLIARRARGPGVFVSRSRRGSSAIMLLIARRGLRATAGIIELLPGLSSGLFQTLAGVLRSVITSSG
jgi:hypothetical protein